MIPTRRGECGRITGDRAIVMRCVLNLREGVTMAMTNMELTKFEMKVPVTLLPYLDGEDERNRLRQCALLIYPYIQDGRVSHGRAAEILGMRKLDLIMMYGEMGLPYFQQTEAELEKDLETLRKIRERTA